MDVVLREDLLLSDDDEVMSDDDEVMSDDDEEPHYRLQYTLGSHEDAVSCVKFSPSGDTIASSSFTKIIKLWGIGGTTTTEKKLLGHRKGISEIDWSKDGSRLVSASDDKSIKIWNVDTGECVKSLLGHEDFVFSAKFSNDGNYILSGSDDNCVRLWYANSGKCSRILRHWNRVTSVDFNKDTTRFLTSSYDHNCYVYDLRTMERTYHFCTDQAISFAKFSPNYQYVLYATLDNTLGLYDLRKNKCIRRYTSHKNEIFSIIANFSTSGQHIVSGSEDNCIYIWGLNSQQLVERLTGHSACVICVDCHPRRDMIVSGALNDDNSIKIWEKY